MVSTYLSEKYTYGLRKFKNGLGSKQLGRLLLAPTALTFTTLAMSPTTYADEVTSTPTVEVVSEEVLQDSDLPTENSASTVESTYLENDKGTNTETTEVTEPTVMIQPRALEAPSTASLNLTSGEEAVKTYVGDSVKDNVTVMITGTDKTYKGAYLEYVVEEDGPLESSRYVTVSEYKNEKPQFNINEGIYKQNLGDLISGSSITLPFVTTVDNFSNPVNVGITIRLKDETGEILAQTRKDVYFGNVDLGKPNVTLVGNVQSESDGKQVLGERWGGVPVSKSKRAYQVTLDEKTIATASFLFKEKNNPLLAMPKDGYRVRVSYDSSKYDFISYGASSLPTLTHFNEGEGYVETNELTLQDIAEFNNNRGFYLIYKGTDEVVPDTVLKATIVDNKGNTLNEGNTYSHSNTWNYLAENPKLVGEDLLAEETVRVDPLFAKIDTTGDKPQLIPTQDLSKSSTLVGRDLTTKSYLTLETQAGDSAAKPMILTEVNWFSPSVDKVAYAKRLEVDLPVQRTGDKTLANTGLVRFTSKSEEVYSELSKGLVYYVDINGERHELGTFSEVVPKRVWGDFMYFENASKIVIEFPTNTPLEGDASKGVLMQAFSTSKEDTPYEKYKTNYTLEDDRKFVQDFDDKLFQATTHLVVDSVVDGEYKETTFTNWSQYAGFIEVQRTSSPRIRIQRQALVRLVGDTFTGQGYLYNHNGGSAWDVGDNAYAYLALDKGIKVNSFSVWSGNDVPYEVTEQFVGNRVYNIYKFKLPELPVAKGRTDNTTTVGFNATISQDLVIGMVGEELETKVYYGIGFDGDVARNSSYYYSGGTDALDLNKDNKDTDATSTTTDPFIILGTESSIRVAVPRSLFIYDKSNSTTTQPTYDTKDVLAGENVTITPTIMNNTEGTVYENMTVITTLANPNDEVFDGSTSRGSQFKLSLLGPVIPPNGWTVYYSTEEQVAGQSASDLTNWTTDISDWSKVTALKYISNTGTKLSPGDVVTFPYLAQTDPNAPLSSSVTTTTAISVNGSPQYLEGYRSTVALKKMGRVVATYHSEDGEPIIFSVDGDTPSNRKVVYNPTPVGEDYTAVGRGYKTITDVNGVEWALVEDKLPDNETGTIIEGEIVVPYIYKRVFVPMTDTPPPLEQDKPTLEIGRPVVPPLDYDLPILEIGRPLPPTEYDLPKLEIGRPIVPPLEYDLPKLDIGRPLPPTEFDLPKLDIGRPIVPPLEQDKPKLEIGKPIVPPLEYDLPKLELGRPIVPPLEYDLPKLDLGMPPVPPLEYDLPKLEIPQKPVEPPTEPSVPPTLEKETPPEPVKFIPRPSSPRTLPNTGTDSSTLALLGLGVLGLVPLTRKKPKHKR